MPKTLSIVYPYKLVKEVFGQEVTPHSLRAGSITGEYKNGANIKEIMQRSRHKDLNTAMGYVRIFDKWEAKIDLGI